MSAVVPRRLPGRHPEAAGAAYVLTGAFLVQGSAALATTAFDAFGTVGTSALRFAAAAVLLTAVLRPRVRGRSRRDWAAIVAMGTALAAMSVGFYCAIERIPLGSAVAILFAGPLSIAVAASRRPLDVAWALLAATGIVLVSGGLPRGSLGGVAFALGAAVALAAYLVCSRRVGERFDGFDGLALAIGVSALLTSPLALAAAAGATAPGDFAIVGLLALTGLALPYALEFSALRRVGVRVVSILLSFDPVVAALVGLVALHQHLGALQLLGIALVTIASCGVVAGPRSATPPDAPLTP